ncbi:MAG: cytochrome c [Hyphomicrobiales bacterium]|nr:cytochrome c [Hyphomicrobiales bacterium]
MRFASSLFALVLLSAPAAQAASRAQGRRLVQPCAHCHAIGPQGASPNPKSPPFRTLGKRYPVSDLQEALVEGIVVGHDGMPQFDFTADQARDIVAYLKSIQRK